MRELGQNVGTILRVSQTINYDVPPEKLPELAEFDGSLIVYRTAGQVTASCDNESANFLAVNLMHDIVTGRRTAEEARKELAEQQAAWLLNREGSSRPGHSISAAWRGADGSPR